MFIYEITDGHDYDSTFLPARIIPIILYDAIECISKLESEYLIQIKSYDGL